MEPESPLRMTTHCPGCLGKSRIGEERETVEPESFDHRHSPHEETINTLIYVVTGFILITSVHDSTQRNTLHLAWLNFALVGSKNEIERFSPIDDVLAVNSFNGSVASLERTSPM
ncbi:hypothetical protein PGT21_025263 [Puccinia graminis f. sp. tritici]|uniref:Uncharacterized protein n=1 Tax=Puccinia graminis f. sp. tritici TaxID=56615 RepID=A0A5B0MPL2_PUCGR|nr:hypothetical protein PGT21_025263 [Puccinia graminis f. sp. tritici]